MVLPVAVGQGAQARAGASSRWAVCVCVPAAPGCPTCASGCLTGEQSNPASCSILSASFQSGRSRPSSLEAAQTPRHPAAPAPSLVQIDTATRLRRQGMGAPTAAEKIGRPLSTRHLCSISCLTVSCTHCEPREQCIAAERADRPTPQPHRSQRPLAGCRRLPTKPSLPRSRCVLIVAACVPLRGSRGRTASSLPFTRLCTACALQEPLPGQKLTPEWPMLR